MHTPQYTQTQNGFTLIELMVVVSIIVLLSGVTISYLFEAQGQARDAVRLGHMEEIYRALQEFHFENGRFPDSQDGIQDTGEVIGVGGDIDAALAPYLDPIPRDPQHDAGENEDPAAGALYYYSYDPAHIIRNYDGGGEEYCGAGTIPVGGRSERGPVLGFHTAESMENLRRDTCSGGDMGLFDADFNIAVSVERVIER